MALERGRPASSVDRALEGWRREAIESRKTIVALQEHLADTIAERDALLERLDKVLGSYAVWLDESDRRAADLIEGVFTKAIKEAGK